MTIERGLVRTRLGHVHYRATGSGDPVLLFHINQQSSALYLELLTALAPSFRAIALDYPGYGMSDHPAARPTIGDYADCAGDLLDALGHDRAYLVGEAVGCAVAAAFAASRPDRVLGAVLMHCPLMTNPGEAAHTIASIRNDRRPTDLSGFPLPRDIPTLLATEPEHAPLAPTQSWMDRVNTALLEAGRDRWHAAEALIAFDLAGALEAMRCPVLLLTGDQSRFSAYRPAVEARIPGLTSETMPGARFCMGWERAVEVGARLRAFRDAVTVERRISSQR